MRRIPTDQEISKKVDAHYAWIARCEAMTLPEREEELLRLMTKRGTVGLKDLYPPLQEAFISLAKKGKIDLSGSLPAPDLN